MGFYYWKTFLGWILVYIEKYTTFATLFDYTKAEFFSSSVG